jgi:hypothetical protein
MACQWIDEFDQILWESRPSTLKMRDQIEDVFTYVLKYRGLGAIFRLKMYIKERKFDFDTLATRCCILASRYSTDECAKPVILQFLLHYQEFGLRYSIAENIMDVFCEMM